jgi:predicted nucleic acid-binding protein
MPNRIIDCCSLLNLYAGWGGLENLGLLEHSWFICKAVEDETEITREYDDQNRPQDRKLGLQPFVQSGLIQVIAPESEAELVSYLDFAQLVDDGEAQAIALAKHRDLILLTDDKKALNLAHRTEVGVNTISTLDVIREWANHAAIDAARLRTVLTRVRDLARYVPAKNSADLIWWMAQFAD